jgi:hypothetical protein
MDVKTVPALTKQQAYERIREHFSDPDAKLGQRDGGKGCFYRLDDEDVSDRACAKGRCAVGALIPDDVYSEIFDLYTNDTGISALIWDKRDDGTEEFDNPYGVDEGEYLFPEFAPWRDEAFTRFLTDVQHAHDTADNRLHFLTRLDEVARLAGLEVQAA